MGSAGVHLCEVLTALILDLVLWVCAGLLKVAFTESDVSGVPPDHVLELSCLAARLVHSVLQLVGVV